MYYLIVCTDKPGMLETRMASREAHLGHIGSRGDDLLVGGRVVGMMEFGWSGAGIAISEDVYDGVGWTLIPFDPETDPIGETVTRILQALEGAHA